MPGSNTDKTLWFTKLDFGGILNLFFREIPVCRLGDIYAPSLREKFAHTAPNYKLHNVHSGSLVFSLRMSVHSILSSSKA